MAERISYSGSTTLPQEYCDLLTNGKPTATDIENLQRSVQHYFSFDPTTWGGVLICPPGKGPERPYFFPQTEADWLPQVQAIGRLGTQYDYWGALHRSLQDKKVSLEKMISFVVLPLYQTPSGDFQVETDAYPGILQSYAESSGDNQPRFPAYISTINYGGDADFYGSYDNSIFPIRVKTKDGNETQVENTELGLEPQLIQNAWDSWITIEQTHHQLSAMSLMRALDDGDFTPTTAGYLRSYAAAGNKTLKTYALYRAFPRVGFSYDFDAIDDAVAVLKRKFDALYETDEHVILADAVAAHAENLRIMYDTARTFRSDIYTY
ncbi:MAG: hypothetical protein ACEQSA_03740 [Weeksellaceae bacterium]